MELLANFILVFEKRLDLHSFILTTNYKGAAKALIYH